MGAAAAFCWQHSSLSCCCCAATHILLRDTQRMETNTPILDLARNLPLGDLLALGTQLRADFTPDMLLQDVADAIVRVLGFPMVYVRLRNPDTDIFEACAFAGLTQAEMQRLRATPVPPARYQHVLQASDQVSESYLVSDDDHILHGDQHAATQLLLVPLRSHGDRLIGAIYIGPRNTTELDPASVQILEAIARQAGLALEHARLATRMQRLLAKEQLLAELGRDVSATLDLNAILAATAERLRRAFPSSTVLLIEPDGSARIAIVVGSIGAPQFQATLGGWVAAQGLPLLSNDLASEPRIAAIIPDTLPVGSQIAVPLRSGGRVIGALTAAANATHAFTYEDLDLLEAVAAQIGGPIGGALLYQETQLLAEQVRRRAQEAAVLEERSRLARDLHDSVSQQLFSMTLTAQAARTQMEKNPTRAAEQLERLQETAAAALAEMRALIFQLRPPALSDQGLVAALQQHIAALSRREGLHVKLHVVGEEQHAHGSEQALFRIAQEALNNVLKHAGTCHVEIQLALAAEQVSLTIRDNGLGFQLGAESSDGRHLGLVSMRERALELGGRFSVDSQPGQGTIIIVSVP
jgi:signal transduction histidine kinase